MGQITSEVDPAVRVKMAERESEAEQKESRPREVGRKKKNGGSRMKLFN